MGIIYRVSSQPNTSSFVKNDTLTYAEGDGNFAYLVANMSASNVSITGITGITGSATVSGSLTVTGDIVAQKLIVQVITASTELVTGSLTVQGNLTANLGVTGSLLGTASWASNATNATSASYALTSSFAFQSANTSTAISASYANTASYAYNTGRDTIVTNSGASYYIIDGINQPVLTFTPGERYRFDLSGIAGSHPFQFSLTANGPTPYTYGVTSGSGFIQIDVDYATSQSLFYYCTIHSGMGNAANTLRDEKLIHSSQTSSMSVASASYATFAATATSASFATTASFALNAGSGGVTGDEIYSYTFLLMGA